MAQSEDAAQRPPKMDVLAAHDAKKNESPHIPTTYIGNLVSRSRHAAHTAALNQLPDTANLPESNNPLEGKETKAFDHRSSNESFWGGSYRLSFGPRPIDSLRVFFASDNNVGGHRRRGAPSVT